MRLPMRTFWLMSNTIDRIQAGFDLRKMNLNLRTGMNATGDAVAELQQLLIAETGEIVVISDQSKYELSSIRDENATQTLKDLQ